MTWFKNYSPYYKGDKIDLYIHHQCFKNLKKSGVLIKVLARLRRICNTNHFGKEKEGYKFFPKENIGWLKWLDGTRVYYSLFENNTIIITLVAGSKNNQKQDIKQAKEYLNEIQ